MQVIGVALMCKGFAFKWNRMVRAKGIAGQDEANEPFEDVPQVERQDQEFEHLTRVNAFVAQFNIREGHPSSHKDQTEEVDGRESSKWNETVDNHGKHKSLRLTSVRASGFCRG